MHDLSTGVGAVVDKFVKMEHYNIFWKHGRQKEFSTLDFMVGKFEFYFLGMSQADPLPLNLFDIWYYFGLFLLHRHKPVSILLPIYINPH